VAVIRPVVRRIEGGIKKEFFGPGSLFPSLTESGIELNEIFSLLWFNESGIRPIHIGIGSTFG
jgi:hypothetical protein